jgi:hypothetical protein
VASTIYDLIIDLLRDRRTSAAERRRAFAEPVGRWHRILGFDGCAVQLDRALGRAGLVAEAPEPLRHLLRAATGESLRHGLLVHRQLAEVAALGAREGIRVMALKGAARLLAGELPGTRSIADIDLLAAPRDAARLHELLQRELGYVGDGEAYAHHLAGLTRRGSLGIEVHVRLTPTPLGLDAEIWQATRPVSLGGHPIELPSPTNLLLHTLEHAVRVNWTARYRLRDILDVAALFTADVDRERVLAHVAASDCRQPMRTVLAAARDLQPAIPVARAGAWRVVRRVGRARLALATLPRTPLIAERWFRYAGVIAEGSPRTVGRLGLDLARRLATRGAAALALMLGVASCDPGPAPSPFTVTPFVFASNAGGSWGLYRSSGGQVVRISDPGSDDREPNGVGHRLVFTSLRDGDAEIYTATLNIDLTLGTQTRLTSEYGNDDEPALDPSATTIAFVSGRSGTPRVWLMDADGANPRPLETGSASYIPEAAPRWSPSGDRIVFTSTRSGTAQVYVVPAAGGVALQLSHETRGGFLPSWTPDGRNVLYTAVTGAGQVLSVPAAGGTATVFATDARGLGEAVCGSRFCLAVASPLGGAGQVVALTATGQPTALVISQVGDDHRPTMIAR